MKKYLFPIIVTILFALAIALGLNNREAQLFGSNNFTATSDKSLEEYYTAAQNLAKTNTLPRQTTFLAVGDIMLSRSVASAIKKASNPLLPFMNASELLASTDFNFGNLESPLTSNSYFGPSGQMVFNVPPGYADGLSKYNFKILNLANNHAFDQGKIGLDYTRKFLDDNNILHIGTGNNLGEAWTGQVIESNGIKIGFVGASFSSLNDGGKTTNNYVSRIEDVDRLKSSIAALRSKSDFIVVTMHAGEEYTRNPNKAQTAFARAAIDAGADIVIGAHPHWIQTMEKYKDKYIFYSLGNFIFDQMWSQDTKEGLTLKITLAGSPSCHPELVSGSSANEMDSGSVAGMTKPCGDDLQPARQQPELQAMAGGGTKTSVTLKQIELVPVIIENYSQPRMANEQESAAILKKINVNTPIITP